LAQKLLNLRHWQILAHVQIAFKMLVDTVLHPAVEVGFDELVDVTLPQLP